MQNIREFEGEDKRRNPYNNIQHPFFLKPEFILMSMAGLISSAIIVTLWVTSAIGDVDDKANSNAGKIEQIQVLQHEQHENVEKEFKDLKESNKEIKQDMKDGFKSVGDKLDKIIDREIEHHNNGAHKNGR